jgi:hypothetical protein
MAMLTLSLTETNGQKRTLFPKQTYHGQDSERRLPNQPENAMHSLDSLQLCLETGSKEYDRYCSLSRS